MTLKDGTSVQDKRLGRIVHFDERSRNFPVRPLLADKPLRTRKWKVAVVLDQGNAGSCVGNGWAHELIATPKVNIVNEKFAVEQIYWAAQEIDEYPGGSYPGGDGSEGSSVLAGAKAVQALGYMKEYRWCFSLDDVLKTISHIGPVVVGTNWYEGMFEPDSNGFVHPTGSIAGGHCYLLVGNDVAGQYVWAQNSWSDTWGIKGQFKLSYADLARLLGEQGEAVTPVGRKLITQGVTMTKKNVQLETTVKAPASLVGFWSTTVGKTVRAAIYLGVSAFAASVIANMQNNPALFGIYTPFINLLLVFVKNLSSADVKNY